MKFKYKFTFFYFLYMFMNLNYDVHYFNPVFKSCFVDLLIYRRTTNPFEFHGIFLHHRRRQFDLGVGLQWRTRAVFHTVCNGRSRLESYWKRIRSGRRKACPFRPWIFYPRSRIFVSNL